MNKTLIVAKREFFKVVKKPTFWISTLAFPILIGFIAFISGYSADQAKEKFAQDILNSKGIIVVDQSGTIIPESLKPPFYYSGDIENSIERVKSLNADAVIILKSDFIKTKFIEIYSKEQNIFSSSMYNDAAENIIRESILSELGDDKNLELYNSRFDFKVTQFDSEGKEITRGIESLIVPGAAAIIYFILTTFASSYMLMSVAEEKENRAIEIVLSSIKPRNLIWGKIFGQMLIAITQILILTVCSFIALLIINPDVVTSLNLSQLNISVVQIALAVFYTFAGFLILSCLMVGVGAAMPSYKEASSFSSIFIILSILPVYFVTLIITDPSGGVAQFFSYFPLTAPLLLLFRVTIGALGTVEIIASIFILIAYCIIFLWLAFKLFEFGSLEYNNKISFKSFLGSLRK
jgi:ABC-2 type transport system permease protein